MTAGAALHGYIKLVGRILLQAYVYSVFGDIRLAALNGLLVAVLQHFELKLRTAYYGTKSHGYGQADHACSRYAHSHCVFQDVGTKLYVYALRKSPEQLSGLCHTKSYGYRLCAAYCGKT